jgi:predicted phosphodiesterase
MKICFLSDTHCRHNELIIPECDIIIHCGDCTSDSCPCELCHLESVLSEYRKYYLKKEIYVYKCTTSQLLSSCIENSKEIVH